MNFGLSDFFGDLKNFFRGGAVLGIDIGTSAIKIVEIKKTGDRFHLSNYSVLEVRDYLDHPNQALQTSSLKIEPTNIPYVLQTALREMKVKTNTAIATLPAFGIFSTTLDFPELPVAEIEKAIQFQAPQYIPLPVSEVSLEWRVVENYSDKENKHHNRILLTAIPNDIVKSYKQIFHHAGIHLIALEHEAFSLARAIRPSISDAPTLIIDIGAVSTTLFIIKQGSVKMIGQTDFGGMYLTQAISRSLDISMTRAEELKRRRGTVGIGIESELSTILSPFLDVIIQESQRVQNLYESQFGTKVQKVAIAGGGANLQGVEKYAADRLNLVPAHHTFTSSLQMRGELAPATRDIDNRFAVAFGCARRYFS